MEDSQIIDLYWARSEQAVHETDTKYGGYCRAIAHNILKSFEDSEECVADTVAARVERRRRKGRRCSRRFWGASRAICP